LYLTTLKKHVDSDDGIIVKNVKDEGSNLIVMTTTLKSNVKCEVLGVYESFQHTSFGHVFSKVC